MAQLSDFTTEQLRRAVAIKEQIQALENELNGPLGGAAPRVGRPTGRPPGSRRGPGKPPGSSRRKMSTAARAAIAAAQRARWAKQKGETEQLAHKKTGMSVAGRAAIAAAARARWANAKAAGRKGL